jgi:thioredoxin-dependent peroxiredoxin
MAQQLKVLDKAPQFEAPDSSGKIIRLTDYKDKKILLVFFRFAGCPVCNFQMHTLVENYPSLQKQNIEVIAVFESKNETLATYSNDTKISFAVIGDPKLHLYKKYGVDKSFFGVVRTLKYKESKQKMKDGDKMFNGKEYKKDGSMTRMTADFIINPDQTIQKAHYGKFIGDHLPVTEVLNNN